jgi:16S rRNA (cytosine967-C5)-methyltransferase
MIDKLREDWPAEWEKVIGENNRQPPMVLRVALDRQSREQCMQRLRDSGFDCRAHPLVPSAVELDRPAEVSLLPGFAQGLISVQDAGAQLAAGLLAAAPGQRVLDACAAPGGKTVHLLEATPALEELVALDQDERRLARLRENLARCSRQATPVCADLRDLERWWDGQYFDRVLLDAPCSASGVVRRHPDIKCLRRPGDLAAWSARQSELLQSVWRVLAPGGILLYVTCSVFRAENQSTLACFLEHHPDAAAEQLTVSWGRDAGPGRQILPGETGMDGFYYACLKRQPD